MFEGIMIGAALIFASVMIVGLAGGLVNLKYRIKSRSNPKDQ